MLSVPVEPVFWPSVSVPAPLLTLTVPASVRVSVPWPVLPTVRAVLLVQVDPAPSTVAAPVLPLKKPTVPIGLFTAPPLEIVSVPSPYWPTRSSTLWVQVEPAPLTVASPVLPPLKPR